MAPLDTIICALALVFAVVGYRQGFIIGLLSLVGMAIGAVVATRVSQAMLEGGAESPYAPMVGLFGAGALALLGATMLQDLGLWLREKITVRAGLAVDHVLGALLSGMLAVGLVWISANAVVAMPQLRDVRPYVLESEIVARINQVLPPSGQLLHVLASYDPFPTFDGPGIDVAPPDGALPRDPQIRQAARSVVRVQGTACGFSVTGSGWVAREGMVVTNAHVVAGEHDTRVRARDDEWREARLVWMDRRNDLAVLRVSGMDVRPLSQALQTPRGAGGAILGYPENGPFSSTAARFSDTRTVRSDDIYGRGSFSRSVTSFRGLVRHGNSGGPVVDDAGRVITTVFAATVGGGTRGGYGVPNETVTDALSRAGEDEVGSGPCVG